MEAGLRALEGGAQGEGAVSANGAAARPAGAGQPPVATRASALLNYAELARSAGLPASTLKRYFLLLEATFLVQTLPAWSSNLSKRLVKSPKLLLADSGLDAAIAGQLAGRVLSGFVRARKPEVLT